VYLLTVGKDGPKLQPPTGDRSYVSLYRNTPPELPGVSYTIAGKKATVALIAERLGEMRLNRPVLDRTGIKGEFDFKLDYAIDDNPETGPSIFIAIQEQLGLKLEAAKGPIETLIIDHAEKPSAIDSLVPQRRPRVDSRRAPRRPVARRHRRGQAALPPPPRSPADRSASS